MTVLTLPSARLVATSVAFTSTAPAGTFRVPPEPWESVTVACALGTLAGQVPLDRVGAAVDRERN